MEDKLKFYYHADKQRNLRTFLIVSMLIFAFSGIADAVLVPELQYKFGLIRYVIFTPLGLAVFWYINYKPELFTVLPTNSFNRWNLRL